MYARQAPNFLGSLGWPWASWSSRLHFRNGGIVVSMVLGIQPQGMYMLDRHCQLSCIPRSWTVKLMSHHHHIIVIIVIVIIIIWAWKYMQTHKPYLLPHGKLKGPSTRAHSCQLCLEDYTWFCWFGGTSLSALCRWCSGLRLTLQLPKPLDLGKLMHIERFSVLLSYFFVYVWK